MSYLKAVLSKMGKGAVLTPVLSQFLDREALAQAADSSVRRRIARHDAILTIRAMRHRHAEFSHGVKAEGFEFHPSAIGQCLRKLWFEQHDAPRDRRAKDDRLQTYLTFELGSYLHVIVQNLCERAGILLEREFQLVSKAYAIRGTCDGILRIGGLRYVLEIKSINSGQWVKVQREPKFEHKQQAMAYMHVLGIPWAVILYVNKDRSIVKEFTIAYDKEFFQTHFFERAMTFKKHLDKRTMPSREGDSPSRMPCSFCQYASLCFSDSRLKQFIAALKKGTANEIANSN